MFKPETASFFPSTTSSAFSGIQFLAVPIPDLFTQKTAPASAGVAVHNCGLRNVPRFHAHLEFRFPPVRKRWELLSLPARETGPRLSQLSLPFPGHGGYID